MANPVIARAGSVLLGAGLSKTAVAGILGNALQESSWHPGSVGGGGGGLWGFTAHPQSLSDLQGFAAARGANWKDPATQAHFLLQHLSGSDRQALNNQGSPAAAATWFMNKWERPLVSTENQARRIQGAQTAFRQLGGVSGSSSLGAPTSGQGGGQRFRTTPGSTTRTTRQVFNQNAYQQAQARTAVGNLIASTPNPYKAVEAKTGLGSAPNPLISSGLLTPGAMPNPQDFMHAQTTLQHIAGQRLQPHIGAQAGLANKAVTDAANAGAGRDAQKLLNMIHTVVGAQYNQANHDAVSEHHGQIRSQGTDCSGLISWLMGPNGLGIWSSSQATPGIPSAPGIRPGRGRLITLYNNRQAGNAGHVFIRIGNQYFASEGGGVGIHQLPMSEVRNYLQHGSDGGTYQALHPRGL